MTVVQSVADSCINPDYEIKYDLNALYTLIQKNISMIFWPEYQELITVSQNMIFS